jgi:hypothetical protein
MSKSLRTSHEIVKSIYFRVANFNTLQSIFRYIPTSDFYWDYTSPFVRFTIRERSRLVHSNTRTYAWRY